MKNSNGINTLSGASGSSNALFIFGLLLVLALTAFPSAIAQTTQTEPPNKETVITTNAIETAQQEAVKANSVVRGRAVYDDTGRPVRRARVMLLDVNKQGPESIGMTNASGEFQIKNVPAGSYFVMVDATGIITPLSFVDLEEADKDNINIEEIKKHFDEIVVDGTNDVTVKVRARRGGAISGKVTYSDGDPAINVRVNVMRKKDGRIARFITNLNASVLLGIQTDDRGMYRIVGLPPGEYIISASETIDHSGDGRNQRDDYLGMSGSSSLVVTYYEGATRQSSATAIQVEAGQEQKEINVTLVERVLHTLSGTVVARRDSMPIKGAQITINSKDEPSQSSSFPFSSAPTAVATDEQGRFSFNEIPDGVYTLTVDPPYTEEEVNVNPDADEEGQTPPVTMPTATPKHKLTRKQQEVTVSGGDLTDVAITLSEGASVSGTVTVEGGKPLPPEASVMLVPVNMELTGNFQQESAAVSVQPDGTFMIEGVSTGAFYPYVTVVSGDQYYAKTMAVNGADLTRDPLSIGEGAIIGNVRIVISPDGATLSGHILTGGTPVNGARLLLIPADQSRWRARTSYLFSISKGDGSYSTSGAPGDYLIIFLQAGDQPLAVNEAWIRSRAANAQRVTLLPREHKTMDLTAPAQ